MEEVKNFIKNFIDNEFKFNTYRYDINIEDAICQEQAEKLDSFFLSANLSKHGRTGREFQNDIKKQFAIDNYKRQIPRTLFQIQQYKNPKLGEGLQRWLVNDDLFACYTSYTENTGRELSYNKLFYVAETNEGLKIIYDLTFGVKEPGWRHSHDLKINQVKDPGKLIAVEKYQAPEEANSLADYNAE